MARFALTLFVVLALAFLMTAAPAQAEYQFVQAIGSQGTGPGQFHGNSNGVAVDNSGNILATDFFGPVEEFSSSGAFVKQVSSFGGGPGQLGLAWGVAIDHSGNVFVSDGSATPIKEFNSSGAFIRAFGTTGTSSGEGEFSLNGPEGLATDSLGNVWVTDPVNNRIMEFSGTGQFIRQVGSLGSGDGQLHSPEDVAVDSSDNVWVVDTNNRRIEEFSSSEAYISQFPIIGIYAPQGIAIDASGNIFVNVYMSIEEFSSSGALITQFGSGQISNSVAGIAVDAFGNVWVPYGYSIKEFSLVVPEPSTIVLNTIGAIGLLFYGLRRKRSA